MLDEVGSKPMPNPHRLRQCSSADGFTNCLEQANEKAKHRQLRITVHPPSIIHVIIFLSTYVRNSIYPSHPAVVVDIY